ncbi:MAG TPA: outer membrane protein assembly factor BamD [Labilithrix sp.]|nr:outer membrane protein assembly factor BamD [Labilithrix sp.]
MSDPVRLLSSRPDGVARALLESAVTPGPTNAQCDELWSSLASKLPQAVVAGAAAGTAGGALAKAAATSKAVGIGLFVKAAVVVGVIGSLAALGLTRPWESRPAVAPHAVASASAATLAPPRPPMAAAAVLSPPPAPPVAADESTAPPPEAVAPSAPAPRAAAARKPAPIAIETPPPAPVETENALQAESASLLRGRRLLRSGDCEGALAQLQETETRFPRGALAQEREVLSIEALACSGRATTASARAEAFVRDYPTSPHASKVRHFTR